MIPTNNKPEIQISKISKYFNNNAAINNLTLDINKGDLITFVGPNGSGKTTLFKLISTILTPDSGTIKIKNLNTRNKSQLIKSKIGFTSHDSFLYKDLTLKENLNFIGNLFQVKNLEQRILSLCQKFQMSDFINRPLKTLSKGLVKRASLIRTFLNDPEILLLDEPLSDLDVESQKILIEFLKNESLIQKTILISTHQMELCIELKTQIMIIKQGKLIKHLNTPSASISTLKNIYAESIQSGDIN